MSKLIIAIVTNGGNMLNHAPLNQWPVIPEVTPRVVSIKMGYQRFRLKTVRGYNNRGGINNADMGRWINAHYGYTRGLKLLFEVFYLPEKEEILYELKGRLIPY